MGEEKLGLDMSMFDIVFTMSEGNPGALNVVMQMLEDPSLTLDLLLCDSYGIRGSQLYMLHNDCCGRNNDKFRRTLKMIRCGIFSREQIKENLNLPRAIPFIDDNIVIEGVPPYGEEFKISDPKWQEFCDKQKAAFTEELNKRLEELKQYSRR